MDKRNHHKTQRKIDGSGKLTIALKIDKSLNGIPVTSAESEIVITDSKMELETGSSHRISVNRDFNRKLRFFIKENKFISR